jgi:hypothetical protein
MIISDLAHLEPLAEDIQIEGGYANASAYTGAYASGPYYASTYTNSYVSASSYQDWWFGTRVYSANSNSSSSASAW